MAAIKITGFDPDQFEKPDPEPSSRSIRRSPAPADARARPEAPAREVRKPVDKDTAEHLRIKYGLTNVKYTEIAPKKSKGNSSMKSGASNRYGGPRLADKPEKVAGAATAAQQAEASDAADSHPAKPQDSPGADDE